MTTLLLMTVFSASLLTKSSRFCIKIRDEAAIKYQRLFAFELFVFVFGFDSILVCLS